jgi:hypothetical protein
LQSSHSFTEWLRAQTIQPAEKAEKMEKTSTIRDKAATRRSPEKTRRRAASRDFLAPDLNGVVNLGASGFV